MRARGKASWSRYERVGPGGGELAPPALSRRAWLAGLAAAPSLGACNTGRRPRRDSALVVVPEIGSAWARNFNPLLVPGQQLWPAQGGIYEPLMIFNSVKGHYVPWLATEYQWSDGNRALDLRLRQGVRWSDGAPFVVADVEFTFELLRRQPAFDSHGVWVHLERVLRLSDQTVRFLFKAPHVPSLFDVVVQCIVPRHLWSKVDDPLRFTDPEPVGTGPFGRVAHFQQQAYELAKNPRHWRTGRPAYEALRVPAFPSNDQASLALIRGEVDWAGIFMPAIDRIFVRKNPAYNHYWFPRISGTVMLYANTRRKPLDDSNVRKALSMAIDRELLVKVAVHGYTRPADGTGLSGLFDNWRSANAAAVGDWVLLDRARASRLLDQAGLPRQPSGLRGNPGQPTRSLEIAVVSGWSDWVIAGQVVERGLKSVGVAARLRAYDRGAWQEKVQKGDFDLCVGWSNTADSPYRFYRELMGPNTVVPLGEVATSNWHRYGSERAGELLSRFERTSQLAEQRSIMDSLQLVFAQEAPAIPLYPQAAWGEYSDERFTGFPSADNPYARLPPFPAPEFALVLGELQRRA